MWFEFVICLYFMFVNMQTCIIFVFIHKMMDLRKFKTNMKVITSHNSKVGAIREVLNHKCVDCDSVLFVICLYFNSQFKGGGDYNSQVTILKGGGDQRGSQSQMCGRNHFWRHAFHTVPPLWIDVSLVNLTQV